MNTNIHQNIENNNIGVFIDSIQEVKILKRHRTYLIIDVKTDKILKVLAVNPKNGISVKKYVFDNELFVIDFGKVLTGGIKWGFKDKWGLAIETKKDYTSRGYYEGARYIKN